MARLAARLAELAERFRLPPGAVSQLAEFSQLLAEDPLAPTTVRDPDAIVDHHIADSLVALDLEQVRTAQVVADVGSGAGLPGVPLAIALPDASVALIESAGRKCAFLELAVARCGVTNAAVVHARAEEWRDGLGRCDLVVARALAALDVVVEYAAPLLRRGGWLVAWRGRRDFEAEAAGATAAAIVGLEPREILPVQPFPDAQNRHLYLMLKVTDTPAAYPRRPGVARKRPLGAA